MEEVEIKFEVLPERREAVEAALAAMGATRERLQARYFDTPDELLARRRIALRLRREGTHWVQTLKGATADHLRRLEHNVAVEAAAGAEPPALDLSRHHGTAAGDALEQVLCGSDVLPDRPDASRANAGDVLNVRYETDIERTSGQLRVGSSVVEVAFDVGRIVAGTRRHDVCELEFELIAGDVDALVMLACRWIGEHALVLSSISKSERGTRLSRNQPHARAVKARPVDYSPDEPAAVVLRRVLMNCLDQVIANASELSVSASAAAPADASGEHVHQLRVGLRRLRTALREMSRFDARLEQAWAVALEEAFARLGQVRDAQTVLTGLEKELLAAGAPPVATRAALEGDRTPAAAPMPSPAEAVAAPAFQVALVQLLGFCSAPAAGHRGRSDVPGEAPAARRLFAKRLTRLHRRVAEAAPGFAALEPEAQHRVRKQLKRLRYLAEFAEPLYPRRKVARYLDALRPAQDALGLHNDNAVALEAYRATAATDPHAAFAAGWLTARLRAGSLECQQALAPVVDAKRFWR